ncbi:DeoR family transcriptional regulator [Labrys miyagiensis]|uniref:DeoR family transcriptional regulator n=1 Tax=Labrys miyagiensis TaxID=346912 RepID=A0ABQ6CJA6_9HYPH|nr:dienelactone hydrolase family protein [Labrys miyagiensis]GLS20456.1 DeoR family transcriptional regulator [Labrys miyagiensis]
MRLIHRFLFALIALAAVAAAQPALAKMVAKPIDWTLDGTAFHSYLVYDDTGTAKRPGLVMVPNWYGVTDIAIKKAEMIAGKDYVILLTDMYGASVRPKNDDEAQAAIAPLTKDRTQMRKRINYALDQLKAQASGAPIDTARLAAIGFCFGGASVLDLARSGADIKAVVAFHGVLATDDPALAKNIKARVLAMNGADDVGTMPQAPAFLDEMKSSPADWRFAVIGHAVHCFTETEATAATGNCRYDAKAAKESYAMMHAWLAETFAKS